nr:hypothetical protein [Tanacetum cinerariifolium]
KVNKSKDFCKEREQYFEIQDLKAQLQEKGIAIRVIPTSVSRPQLKSNPHGDRVLRSNSRGKKLKVEAHRRNVKLPQNKMSVTASKATSSQAWLWHHRLSHLNFDTINLLSKNDIVHDMCVLKSVAKPLKKTVTSESHKKPRNLTRKLYERVSKTGRWWYPKFTPPGYIWKPKSKQENVNPNVSMPLENASRTANVKDTMTSRRFIVSNTPLSSNSFAAHRDCSIYC